MQRTYDNKAHLESIGINDDPVDKMEPLPSDRSSDLAVLMARLLEWLIAGKEARSYQARSLTLALHLNFDFDTSIDGYTAIANQTGYTRAFVQKLGRELSDQFGLKATIQKNQEEKEKCRKRQTQVHKRLKS